MNYSSNPDFHRVSIKRGMQMMNDTDLSTIVWSLSNPSPTQRISRELSHIASRLPKIFTLGFVTIKLNLVKN